MRVTRQYYEPGRHDRCYRWVWKHYIKDMFHVEYKTYLKWLREECSDRQEAIQQTLFD